MSSTRPSADGPGIGDEHPLIDTVLDDVARFQPEVVDDLDETDIAAIEPERITGSVVATLAVLVIAAFVAMLNETALGVALPAVMGDLHVPVEVAQWLTTGFLLTMAVVIPTTGWLMQRMTTRALFLTGMVVFSAGTLLAALSPTFALLLVGRVLQASGTAVIMPQLMATTLSAVPVRYRGTVMGFNTVVIMAAPAMGPTMSGLVVDTLGWRWLFGIVLPIAVVVTIAGAVLLKTDGTTTRVRLDVLSVLLSLLGFGGLIFAMASVGAILDGAVLPLAVLVVGVTGLVLFVVRQVRVKRRGGPPLMDLDAFRVPNFRISMIMAGALMATLFGALTVLPIHLQLGLHISAVTTGLMLLPGPLMHGLIAPLIGRISDAVGPRPLVIPGSIMVAAAVFGYTTLGPGVPPVQVVAISMFMFLGLALVMTPLFTAALGSLPKELYGHGSAILNTLQQLMGAAGTGLIVAIMGITTTIALNAGSAPDVAQISGSRVAFVVSGCVALVAVVGSLLIRRTAQETH